MCKQAEYVQAGRCRGCGAPVNLAACIKGGFPTHSLCFKLFQAGRRLRWCSSTGRRWVGAYYMVMHRMHAQACRLPCSYKTTAGKG
jgi:hypothetical protein